MAFKSIWRKEGKRQGRKGGNLEGEKREERGREETKWVSSLKKLGERKSKNFTINYIYRKYTLIKSVLGQIILKLIWNLKNPEFPKQSWREKKKNNWKHKPPRLQTILQRYSNQNSMVLAQKQTYGSMEQNTEPQNKPTHPESINLWQRNQEYTMEKKIVSWASGIRKAAQPHVNQCS